VREVGEIVAGSDAAGVALVPVADALDGTLELAFDHGRILADGVERARVDLEQPGLAISFVGTTFTLAELQAVYDAVWGVTLDPANSRRALVAEDGWIVPTGKCAQPGPAGGKPAELYRAGRSWAYGSPIRRPRRARREKGAK
jgi:8-oxo-dGTP diphosphatase